MQASGLQPLPRAGEGLAGRPMGAGLAENRLHMDAMGVVWSGDTPLLTVLRYPGAS